MSNPSDNIPTDTKQSRRTFLKRGTAGIVALTVVDLLPVTGLADPAPGCSQSTPDSNCTSYGNSPDAHCNGNGTWSQNQDQHCNNGQTGTPGGYDQDQHCQTQDADAACNSGSPASPADEDGSCTAPGTFGGQNDTDESCGATVGGVGGPHIDGDQHCNTGAPWYGNDPDNAPGH